MVQNFEYNPYAQLSTAGILPGVDVLSYLRADDAPVSSNRVSSGNAVSSPYSPEALGIAPKLNIDISKDSFVASETDNNSGQGNWKKWLAGGLVTYLAGFALSKGKVNPLQWGPAIKNIFTTAGSWIGKLFKKS